MNTPAGFLTCEQAAERRGISSRRMRKLCQQGRISGALKRLEPGKIGLVYAIPPDFEILPGRPVGNPAWQPKRTSEGKL